MATIYTIDPTTTPIKSDLIIVGQADKERSATIKDITQAGLSKENVSDNLEVWQKGIPEDFDNDVTALSTDRNGIAYNLSDWNNKTINIIVGQDFKLIVTQDDIDKYYYFDIFISNPFPTTFSVFLKMGDLEDLVSKSSDSYFILRGWYKVTQYTNNNTLVGTRLLKV